MRARHEEPVAAFDDAVREVRARARPLGVEPVSLPEAYGRVLAEEVTAPHALPPFDNSMVDGYAVLAADVVGASPEGPVELEVVAEIPAGRTADAEITRGHAVRIMTGAPVPASADAIVMLEWTETAGNRVRIRRPTDPGRFIRRAGEDLSEGDLVLGPGRTLGAAEVGLLASLGRSPVAVHRRPLVAVLATGDELLRVDEPLAPGKIRSSNDYTLAGQVREAGADLLALGLVGDDRRELAASIERGRDADVILTSGGVSVGDRDEVQDVLLEAGFVRIFWRVASSPGKPLLFGALGSSLVFGLPGNPVSSMVAFENFVRPTLRRMQGDGQPDRVRVRARAGSDIGGPEDRRHFARVRLVWGDGGFVVREVGPHGSGNLRSMVNANALAIVPEGRAKVKEGDEIDVVVLGDPDRVEE